MSSKSKLFADVLNPDPRIHSNLASTKNVQNLVPTKPSNLLIDFNLSEFLIKKKKKK